MLSLFISCPTKKKVVVKVAPNTRMQEVLSEASKKQGYVSDQYVLQYKNKPLDSSLSFRLSGLPNNCTLEMVPNPTGAGGPKIVEIALQLSVGGRHMKKLSHDLTLAQVLESFQTEVGFDLLSPEGELMQPIVAHMNTEFIGLVELGWNTLQSLGINQGRELLRYSSRVVNEEKMKQIEENIQVKKNELDKIFEENRIKNEQREQLEIIRQQEEQEIAVKPPDLNIGQPEPLVLGLTNRLNRLNELLTQVNESLDSSKEIPWQSAFIQGRVKLAQLLQDQKHTAPSSWLMEFADFKFPAPPESITSTCERQAIVYEVEGTSFEQLRETPDSQFFDVTESDFLAMHISLKETRWLWIAEKRKLKFNNLSDSYTQASLVSAPMISRRNAQRKQNAWKHTVIRVLFPNKLLLQLCFLSQEKVSQLYAAVHHCLTGVKKFSLSVPPNLAVEESNSKSLIDAELAPASNVVLKVKEFQDDKEECGIVILNPVLVSQKRSLGEAEIVAKEWLLSNSVYVPYRPTVTKSTKWS